MGFDRKRGRDNFVSLWALFFQGVLIDGLNHRRAVAKVMKIVGNFQAGNSFFYAYGGLMENLS
jgi:hypothetical protein